MASTDLYGEVDVMVAFSKQGLGIARLMNEYPAFLKEEFDIRDEGPMYRYFSASSVRWDQIGPQIEAFGSWLDDQELSDVEPGEYWGYVAHNGSDTIETGGTPWDCGVYINLEFDVDVY